jgi:hypothetical protein
MKFDDVRGDDGGMKRRDALEDARLSTLIFGPRSDADLLQPDSPFRPAGDYAVFLAHDASGDRASVVAFAPEGEADTGLVGYLEIAREDDVEAGAAVLTEARRWLAERGRLCVRGPINFTTWRGYRVVLDEPPGDVTRRFFLEPHNHKVAPAAFAAAGFVEVARYGTVEIPHVQVGLTHAATARAKDAGVVIEPLDAQSDDALLPLLYDLSLRCFGQKTGFQAISRAHFDHLYGSARALLVPGLSVWARDAAGTPLGFVFAYPNLVEAGNDAGITCTVVKTLGIADGAPGYLGWALMARHVDAAVAHGFGHGLYALMEKWRPLLRYAQSARKMGASTGGLFQSYALLQTS